MNESALQRRIPPLVGLRLISVWLLGVWCFSPAGAADDAVSVERHDSRPAVAGDAARFTGSVLVDARFERKAPARVAGGIVTFAPGARTAWHSHPLGQTLIVTAGTGLVQSWAQPVYVIEPGDVVWIPPGVKHWHGATNDSDMSHVAITEALDGKTTDWMEQVTDAQYQGHQSE